jgi:hypothetical protein
LQILRGLMGGARTQQRFGLARGEKRGRGGFVLGNVWWKNNWRMEDNGFSAI